MSLKNYNLDNKKSFYAFIFFLLISIILLFKIMTISEFDIVSLYTIFITTFMFSRVIGSFLYGKYENKALINGSNKDYTPSVSFVIPCKNEEMVIYKTISKCLESNYPEDKIEIIAINDGSTDNTLSEMLRAKRNFSLSFPCQTFALINSAPMFKSCSLLVNFSQRSFSIKIKAP